MTSHLFLFIILDCNSYLRLECSWRRHWLDSCLLQVSFSLFLYLNNHFSCSILSFISLLSVHFTFSIISNYICTSHNILVSECLLDTLLCPLFSLLSCFCPSVHPTFYSFSISVFTFCLFVLLFHTLLCLYPSIFKSKILSRWRASQFFETPNKTFLFFFWLLLLLLLLLLFMLHSHVLWFSLHTLGQ